MSGTEILVWGAVFGIACGIVGFATARLFPKEEVVHKWDASFELGAVVTAFTMSHRTETDKVVDQLAKIREAIEHHTETAHLPR